MKPKQLTNPIWFINSFSKLPILNVLTVFLSKIIIYGNFIIMIWYLFLLQKVMKSIGKKTLGKHYVVFVEFIQ